MDSEKYYIEQLLDNDDSNFDDQLNQKKQAAPEGLKVQPLENSIFPPQNRIPDEFKFQQENNTQLGDYQGFQQIKSPYTQTQQLNKTIETAQHNPFQAFPNFGNFPQYNPMMMPVQNLFCCVCKQQIIYEGTYTKIFNQFINEDVCIHMNCLEQIKMKGQAQIQILLQSMIPKFSISFSIPNHQSSSQVAGQDVKAEIRFINPQTMNIINAFMNMKLQPSYDAVNGSWFCSQSIYSQFSVQTSLILIDLTMDVPNLPSKKVRGMINLFEILPMQSQPIVCLQVPLSSRNPMYTQGSMNDQFYLTFNVQLQRDEYLLSNLQFQIEFKDCNLFSLQPPQPILQNQGHIPMQQYPMQMGLNNMDPRLVPNNYEPIKQMMMQNYIQPSPNHDLGQIEQNMQSLSIDASINAAHIQNKKKSQAAFYGSKFYSQNHEKSQSAQLGNSGFKTTASPFFPQGYQYLDSGSAFSDNSSTMSSQYAAQTDKHFDKSQMIYQQPQIKSQEYNSNTGLDRMQYVRDIALKINQMGYYIVMANQQNNHSSMMSPIDSQTEQSLSSKSQNSRKKKDSVKKLMALGQSQSSKQNDKKSSPVTSQISSNTGKKNNNSRAPKTESVKTQPTGKPLDIPHLTDMIEYLISQKGSRYMQQFVKKEATLEQIDKIIERIRNDLGNLMIDKYGNYFCQNLLRTVSPQNRLKVISFLSPDFVKVSCHDVGTHSMQRLLEVVTMPEEKEVIFNALKLDIEMMAKHPNGNYVLTLAFQVLEQPHLEYIIEVLLPHLFDLSLNKQGICIVNKMISQTLILEHQAKIVEILSEKLIQIIQDPFGNYAVTQALQTWDEDTCGEILKKFKKNFTQLAIQNFSQQVLEKCVERASPTLIKEFFEILQRENVMKSMMKNKHSIFIVQKIHQRLSCQEDFETMKSLIQKNICYVNEKMIKSKGLTVFQAYLDYANESQSKSPVTSQPNSGNHSRQPSGQSSPSLLK